MSSNTSDNLFVPPKPKIEKLSRERSPSVAGIVLLLSAAPMFLYCFFSLFVTDSDVVFVMACIFVVTYVAMLFRRKVWAYFLCAIYACWWIIQTLLLLFSPTSQSGNYEDAPFEGLFILAELLLFGVCVLYALLILILSVICGLSAWRNEKKFHIEQIRPST